MKRTKCDFKAGYGHDLPPPKEYVRIYFLQKGLDDKHADLFWRQYDHCNWTDHKGRPFKNWKTLACDWIWTYIQAQKKRSGKQ